MKNRLEIQTTLFDLALSYLSKKGVLEPTVLELLIASEKILQQIDMINRDRKLISFKPDIVSCDEQFYTEKVGGELVGV